jgi:hypothetical protein
MEPDREVTPLWIGLLTLGRTGLQPSERTRRDSPRPAINWTPGKAPF